MAETRKGFWKWLWEDVIVAFAVAAGLDILLKTEFPKLLTSLGGMLGSTVAQKVNVDKRAVMLREFRRMQNNGINIDNLERRYEDSRHNRPISEFLFVELLSKIPPSDPNDPLNMRPTVAPGTPGAPQDDRQADYKWLNDMSDVRFYRWFDFLHHNVIIQWWVIVRDWVLGVLAGLGPIGTWILGVLRIVWHSTIQLFQWASRSLWRMAFMVLLAAVIFWPLTLIVMAILTWFHGTSSTTQGNGQSHRGIGLFRFIGILIGVDLLIWIWFKLVPTWANENLTHVVVIAIAATFFFWSVSWVRMSLLALIGICTLIICLDAHPLVLAQAKTNLNGMVLNPGYATPVVIQQPATRTRTPVLQHQSPPKDNGQPVGDEGDDDSKDGGDGNVPASPKVPARAPVEWFKPIAGDEGAYIVRISSARYVTPGKVRFNLSVQPPDDSTIGSFNIDESDGGDNRGSFSAYLNSINENYIHCNGPAYPCKMLPGMPTFLTVEVNRPSGVNKLSFRFKIAPGGGAWTYYTFAEIPVAER